MASIYKRSRDKNRKGACWYFAVKDHLGKRRIHRGFTDRVATERLALQLEEQSRQVQDGFVSPASLQLGSARKQPITEHVTAFEKHLRGRDVTAKQVHETITRLNKLIADKSIGGLGDFDATAVESFLADLRECGRSKQTSNHYLKAAKQFGGWLVRTKRLLENPVAEIKRLNVQTDPRHRRRPLADEEMGWLVEAAKHGRPVESICGVDRAMMYLLAAWTGFRKGEIGSLRMNSFNFNADTPTVTVTAMFSKRKREDTQALHAELAKRMQKWFAGKGDALGESLLFPVSGKVPGGTERKTEKMMKRDLEAARKMRLKAAKTDDERQRREKSDFLQYCDSQGRFADFHANRHTFITNLGHAGVSPKAAQELARHSDIRLTLGVYSHTDFAEKAAAINRLPALTDVSPKETNGRAAKQRRRNTKGRRAQRPDSAPKAQADATGHPVTNEAAPKSGGGDAGDSPEVVVPSAVGTTSRDQAEPDGSIPGRVRTCNLRLRRPTLYPIELRGRDSKGAIWRGGHWV